MQASHPPPSIESVGGKLLATSQFEAFVALSGHLLWIAPLVGAVLVPAWLIARYLVRSYHTAELAYQRQKAAGRLSDGPRNLAGSS